jgi:hypothetical protein
MQSTNQTSDFNAKECQVILNESIKKELNNFTIHFDASELPKFDNHYGFISYPYGFQAAYEQHLHEQNSSTIKNEKQ